MLTVNARFLKPSSPPASTHLKREIRDFFHYGKFRKLHPARPRRPAITDRAKKNLRSFPAFSHVDVPTASTDEELHILGRKPRASISRR